MGLIDVVPRPLRLAGGRGVVRTVRSEEGSPVRVLQVGGVYQSATYLDGRRMEPVFSYYRAFDCVFAADPGARRLLMVGGGGYAWPKHVLATRPDNVTIDVVEIDPSVTRAARRWFFLDEAMERWPGRLRLVEGDGRAFLEGAKPGTYDAIVLDAFAGTEPVRALATVEAARAARACLAPGGVLVSNVVSGDGGADVGFLRSVVATWREVFPDVRVLACEDEPFAVEDNYLVVATTDVGPRADTSGSGAARANAVAPLPGEIPYDREFLGELLRDEVPGSSL